MADLLTAGSTVQIAWENCLRARQAAALIVARVATQGNFVSRWQALETDANTFAEVLARKDSILSTAEAYNAALALHARYFAIAGEAATVLGTANTVLPPVNVEGVIVRTAESVANTFSTLLSLAIVGVAGYFLYKWATKEEDYPRHLAPRYAGGSRRL